MVKCFCDLDLDDAKTREFLDEFTAGEMDFNDIIIRNVCSSNNLILVTDDGDFKNCSNITILTANYK